MPTDTNKLSFPLAEVEFDRNSGIVLFYSAKNPSPTQKRETLKEIYRTILSLFEQGALDDDFVILFQTSSQQEADLFYSEGFGTLFRRGKSGVIENGKRCFYFADTLIDIEYLLAEQHRDAA